MTQTYEIKLIRSRLITECQVITVDATSEAEAHRKAWDEVGDDWREDSSSDVVLSPVESEADD